MNSWLSVAVVLLMHRDLPVTGTEQVVIVECLAQPVWQGQGKPLHRKEPLWSPQSRSKQRFALVLQAE